MMIQVLLLSFLYGFVSSTFVTDDDQQSNCTCVPYYQCSEETGNVIKNGVGLFDLRTLQHAKCTGYFDVCCNITTEDDKDSDEVEEKPNGCGYHVPKIFPWSVILRIQKSQTDPYEHKCGASLIHRQVAITAAHCVNGDGNYEIKIGEQMLPVSRIVIHPRFNINTLQNDIAILILKNNMNLSENVGTICIPPPRFSIDSSQCVTSSWNHTDDSNPIRRIVRLPLMSRKKCESTLRATRLGSFFQLDKSFICAGGEAEKDTCNGDGGSPMVCPVQGEKGRFHQVGIVSWGIGCGEFNLPGVYVNLSIFRNWIDKIMIKNGFDINTYRY